MLRTLLSAALGALLSGAATPAPPRVLIVDLDDLGPELIGSTPTPTLDRIVAEGRRFVNFYTAPLCTPTRLRMNLGAYGSHPDVLIARTIRRSSELGMPVAPLEPLAGVLSAAGYSTAKVGKWHLCPVSDATHPNRAGWQHYAGVLDNVGADSGYVRISKVVDGETSELEVDYLTTDETDDAIRVLRKGVDLVSVSYHAIHRPYHVPPRELYDGPRPDTPLDRARAMLIALDRELGRLLEVALEQRYTVLLFTDNGTSMMIDGDKGEVSESAVRMPLFAVGAGVVPGTDDSLVGVEDVYATVLELFGVPGGPRRGPHSISFAPQLAGRPNPEARRWLYTEVWAPNGVDPRSGELEKPWLRAIRDERYKLVRDGGERLYDLERDPLEEHDLLAQEGELDGELRAVRDRLRAWMDGI